MNEQNMMGQGNQPTPPTNGNPQSQQQGGQVDPKTQQEIDRFTTFIAKLIHGKETRASVINLLKSAKPELTIPEAAVGVTLQASQLVDKKGTLSDEAKLAGLLFAVTDLAELSKAVGTLNYSDPKELQPIFHETIKQVVRSGLADGSIDPIKLQAMTEEILPPQIREVGRQMAQQLGLPEQPTQDMAYNQLTEKKTRPLRQENEALKKQMLSLKGGQQQEQQQPQQGGPPAALASMFGQGGR